jgi:competence protein ComGC
MRPRALALTIFLVFLSFLPLMAQHEGSPGGNIQQMSFSATNQAQEVQQNETAVQITNASENPDFSLSSAAAESVEITTVKSLVPYEDLYKVLQQDIGKYFILPIEEFESLKAAKEAWLASQSAPVIDPPPFLYQINSVQLEGKLEENFAHISSNLKIETFTDGWHEIPILWGSLAVEAVKIDGNPTTLKTSWIDSNTRQVNFGKMSRQNILQNMLHNSAGGNDTLSQNNWKDTMFSLPIRGKGKHEAMISFVVPIQNHDDLFTLQFNMARIPLAFMKLKAKDFILSVDNTSFKDFTVIENPANENGCEFIGWLGANSDIQLKWRRKFSRLAASDPVEPLSPENEQMPELISTSSPEIENSLPVQIKPVVMPLVYARSSTLVSLGETSIQANKTIDFTISKAPVSSFTFNVPEDVEIVYLNADRPHTYRMIREGSQKRLRVEFVAGREDVCQIEISYEAPVNTASAVIGIPEVMPLNVERELGAVAIEALNSVEVQPGNDDKRPLSKGVYTLDPLEAPQPLKDRATRPILLAYRQNSSPSNILLNVKRYMDVPQQTVVADSMEVKTTFTTNKTSNSFISMNIRNNNKQYLQLQLASGSEIISAFRSGAPVKLVAGKNDGKVQIPLEMSQTVGEPVEMSLQILLKQPVNDIYWKGNLGFEPPLVDIPVSRFSWYIYSPEDYHLFNFFGTVKERIPRTDPFFFRGFVKILRAVWKFCVSPEAFLTAGFFLFIILMVVSRNLLFAIIKFIWKTICAVFSYIFSGKGFRLAELMIVMVIIAIMAAISIPNFRKSREQARDKACFANLRVLTGAVEMYNMDTDNPMNNLDIDQLVQKKYLKAKPYPPESGCRYLSHGNLAEDGYVYCQLHGSLDGASEGPSRSKDQASNEGFARKMEEKAIQAQIFKQSADMDETAKAAPSFGATKVKGMQPIKSKFVMTKNYYALERDLVISDVASDGALLANSTSPRVQLSYVHVTALRAGEIIAFFMALFAGLYFVSGAFLGYSGKITLSAVLIIVLSLFDLKLKSIGDAANLGLWLALCGALLWKTIWLLGKIRLTELDNFTTNTPPPAADLSNIDITIKNRDSGHISLNLLLWLALISLFFMVSSGHAAEKREIRIMAPFKELSKVIPTGDRVVIIPEADYRYLRDIVEPVKPEVIAPQSYRFESVAYRGTIEDRGVRFSAEFRLEMFNSGWKKVSLLSPAATPSFASLNGSLLPMNIIEDNGNTAYGFITNATGSALIKVDFFVPLASSEYRHTSRFTLNTVPVCLSSIEITAKEKDCEAWIDPGVLQPAEKRADSTVFRAILPPTDSVSFELYRNVVAQNTVTKTDPEETQEKPVAGQPVVIEEKTRITAQQHNLLYFKEGFVSGINTYELKIKGGSGIASLSFDIPERIRVLKVENKLIEDWKISEKPKKRQLELVFKSRIRGNTEITIEFEEDIQNLKDGNYIVPEIIAPEVEHSFGLLGIGCLQTLEISISTPQGYSPIIAAEFLKDWNRERPEKTPYAFKFLRHPNHMEVTISRRKISVSRQQSLTVPKR